MEFKGDTSFLYKFKNLMAKAESTAESNEPGYVHCVKADALRIKNYFAESIEEYSKALSYNKDDFQALKGIAESLKQLSDFKEAAKYFEKARRLSPFDKSIYAELGCCYTLDNKFPSALAILRKAIKLDPNFLDAKMNLAIAHEYNQEQDMAIKIYKRIIDERPSFIAAYNNLASLYMKLGFFKDSIATYLKIIKINPEFSKAYLGIAVTFDKMGEKASAIRYYKKYLTLKPASANAPYVIERLELLKNSKIAVNKPKLKLLVSNK